MFCLRADVHTAVCNSVLLARAGISRDTPDPGGARFGRFPDGTPNGVLEEFAALEVVRRLKPVADEDTLVCRIVALNDHYGRLGITTVDDLLATTLPNSLSIFRRASEAGFLGQAAGIRIWHPSARSGHAEGRDITHMPKSDVRGCQESDVLGCPVSVVGIGGRDLPLSSSARL